MLGDILYSFAREQRSIILSFYCYDYVVLIGPINPTHWASLLGHFYPCLSSAMVVLTFAMARVFYIWKPLDIVTLWLAILLPG